MHHQPGSVAGARLSIWNQGYLVAQARHSQWGEDQSERWQQERLEEEREAKGQEGGSSCDTEREIKTRSPKGARRKGEEVVASGKSWLSFHGEAGIICSPFTPNTNCSDAVSFQVFLRSSTGVDTGLG